MVSARVLVMWSSQLGVKDTFLMGDTSKSVILLRSYDFASVVNKKPFPSVLA